MSIVKAVGRTLLSAGALGVLTLAPTSGAQAQTAAQYNQAAAAIQMCASPLAASIPQCAQLNGQLGLGGGAAATGGNAGASAAAGLLGALAASRGATSGGGGGLMGALGALANSATANAAVPQQAPQNAGAIQMAFATCVQRAGVNQAALQACNSILAGYTGAAPAYPAAAAPTGYPTADYYTQSAMATQAAAGNYQACVAANPQNWQGCLATMNGATGAGLANAGVTQQQLQAATGAAAAQAGPAAAAALNALSGFLKKK